MPRESRFIYFNEFEAIDALRRFVEASGWDLGDDRIDRVQAYNERPVRAVGLCDSGQATRKVSFSELDLARALLTYCFEHGIPIPRRGQKEVRILDGCLALVISLKT